jgi:OTU domain-containing protein 5
LHDTVPLRVGQHVQVRPSDITKWTVAQVMRLQHRDVYVRYASWKHAWVPFTPSTLAPMNDDTVQHQSSTRLSLQRPLYVMDNATTRRRARIIPITTARFTQYRDALGVQGLHIYTMEGDGNCLFRTVSHQVYGDDRHYALVRKYCMDYMEYEKEYFEPYVVGDMTDFMRYVQYKRQDGVWGDDPEIQAMCELYNRPAQVYAYDAVHGYRTLRQFHENNTSDTNGALLRNRPSIWYVDLL